MTKTRLKASTAFTLEKFVFTVNDEETAMTRSIPMRQMQVGQKARITSVEAKGEVNQRIRDMGLIPGSTVSIVGRAPLGDPVAVRLSGVTISLRNNEADHIHVEVL